LAQLFDEGNRFVNIAVVYGVVDVSVNALCGAAALIYGFYFGYVSANHRELHFIQQLENGICPQSGCTGSNRVKNNGMREFICFFARFHHGSNRSAV
jgi:hypothetical protein